MRYEDAKNLIQKELSRTLDGLTWVELNNRLKLPYKSLCPEWTKQLEKEIGLIRKRSAGRAFLWTLSRKGSERA